MSRASSMPSMTSSSMPGLAPRALDERGAVRRLADRARRRRAVDVDLGPVHRLAELAERGAGLPDRRRRELARHEDLAAEAHGRAEAHHLAPGRAGVRQEGELLPVETSKHQPRRCAGARRSSRGRAQRSAAWRSSTTMSGRTTSWRSVSRQPLRARRRPRPLPRPRRRQDCRAPPSIARSGTFSSRARRLVEGSRSQGRSTGRPVACSS